MPDEPIDVLDENGNPTGRITTNEEAHAQGLWHRVAHVWMYNRKGEVVLQKRSPHKETSPSLWDISAAGHIRAGESPIEGALRELKEELGIAVSPGLLKKIMVRKTDSRHARTHLHTREFAHVYILLYNAAIEVSKLQSEEVECIKYVSIVDFRRDLSDPEKSKLFVPHGAYYFDVLSAIQLRMSKPL